MAVLGDDGFEFGGTQSTRARFSATALIGPVDPDGDCHGQLVTGAQVMAVEDVPSQQHRRQNA
ncbi:hypothetical protein [Mycobacterium decipiens]|uniref:hypothetical protein n=1 Tax=Mycobacterium decipiens TaxID=1430326 RepID=UPI001054AD3C|nr:hypothetical protein [Mycobacterium decipiens]